MSEADTLAPEAQAPQAKPQTFTPLGGAAVGLSDDGAYILLSLMTTDGGEPGRFALPNDGSTQFIESVSQAAKEARKISTGQPDAVNFHEVGWWTVSMVPNTLLVVMTFTTPSGGTFSFRVHRDAADKIRETLGVAVGYHVVPTNATVH